MIFFRSNKKATGLWWLNGGIELARISNPGWEDIKGEKFAYFFNEDQATFLGTLPLVASTQ